MQKGNREREGGGAVISLILFALNINDCEMEFIDNNCELIELKELSLFLIIYTDDMGICSEYVEDLQMTWWFVQSVEGLQMTWGFVQSL